MTNRRRMTDEELQRRLTAYAQARLSPTPETTARIRARVIDAATNFEAPKPGAAEAIPFAAYRARLGARKRVFAALMAAALSVLLLATVALASAPGDPLYGFRLWAETVGLPSEPGARADADVDRLDARVDEAVRAGRTGNGTAISAALAAYRDILDDALAAASKDQSKTDRLEAALNRHRIVLATLLDSAPERARDAIQNAIDRSDQAAEGIGAGHETDADGSGMDPGADPGSHANPGADGHGPADPPQHGADRAHGSHRGGVRHTN
jgi:hypothetical protein